MTALLAQSLAIAALLWGQPACGTPTVVYNPGQPPSALGYGDRRSCTTELAESRPAPYDTSASGCTTIVREWGHLAGRGHSTIPRSVMSHEQLQPYCLCRDRWRQSVAVLVDQS